MPVLTDRWRRAGQIVVVLALLFLAGGAAMAPDQPRLDLVASVPVGVDGRMVVSGSRLILIDRDSGRLEISAFALPGGSRLWRSPLRSGGAGLSIVTTPSTVIVMSTGAIYASTAEAFDLRTGASLWRLSAIAGMSTDGDTVLVTGAPSVSGTSTLHVIDAKTGVTRWTATIPPDCQTKLVNDGAPTPNPGLIELCVHEQRLRVLALDTGAARAEIPLDLFPVPRGPDSADLRLASPGVESIGDLVIVLHDNYPTATFDAYRARDLSTVWTGVAATASSFLYACEPDICMTGGGVNVVIDPLTGRRLPGVSPPTLGRASTGTGPGTGGSDGGSTGGGGGSGVSSGSGDGGSHGDAPTTLVVVPTGQTATTVVARGVVLDFAYPRAEDTTVRIPLAGGGLTWVARQVMTDTGYAVEPLELLHGVSAAACVPISRYVACAMAEGNLNIWRLP